MIFFYFQCLQLDRGLVAFLPAQLSSIIDACKLLLFYLQLGGYEPVVEMACGGLFIDSMHTLKHTYACTHARTSHFTHAIVLSLLPAALLNWGISGSEMKLVNLDCFYDWLDMICIIIWTQRSFSLSHCLPPMHSLTPSHSFHYLDWLLWNPALLGRSASNLKVIESGQPLADRRLSNFHLSLRTRTKSMSQMWRWDKQLKEENWDMAIQSDSSPVRKGWAHKLMYEKASRYNQ